MRFFLAALAALAFILPALANGPADWVMQGQHRTAAGEWCCGEGDCSWPGSFRPPSSSVLPPCWPPRANFDQEP